MGAVRKYAGAERDLVEIGVYIALDSLPNALRFIDSLEREFQKLADAPFVLGRSCEGLRADLRRHNFRKYVIVFRPIPEGIELVGVFQGSRNLEAVFRRLNERVTKPEKYR